jgi:ribose 5-phosphate isomerase B
MKIAIACDHGGFPLKEAVTGAVRNAGCELLDLGAFAVEPDDYPDYAEKMGWAIQSGKAERGILLCGSGVGASIAANKLKGVYAAVCHDVYSAHQGVEHDNMNVLCMGARVVGTKLAEDLVATFLAARFRGEERYARRIEKVRKLEEG